jgi:hypothetical protein
MPGEPAGKAVLRQIRVESLCPRGACLFLNDFSKQRRVVPMPIKIRMTVLLTVASILLLLGCAASRTYTEGLLATNDTFMSTEELRSYGLKIDQEIDRVNKGGAVPSGVSREVYLEDLKSRQKDVQARIAMAEHFKQKDEFDDKYPSP